MSGEARRLAGGAGREQLRIPLRRLRPWIFFGLVGATTAAGAGMMLDILGAGGLSALEVVILLLFGVTFCWISVPFWTGTIGFALRLLGLDPLSLRPVRRPADPDGACPAGPAGDELPPTGRTALVMPVHNEDPDRVVRGLSAVHRSVTRTGHGDRFDLFLLSDTTDPRIARDEEAAWRALRRRTDAGPDLYYRRRETNAGRKAGNIAEFCRRWGAGYDFLVVLDADSLMSGTTLVELVRRMEANPDAGLIQTLPLPARQSTLFGRLLQFGASVHAPTLATGRSFWQVDAGNYWGHNAIVRVRAFAEHCRLPVLPGTPPLGGAILSHDFVEAALLRRAGWRVYLMPWLGGSYEEVPATIPDFATRDRRWAQGSLQHLRLLTTPGLHPLSRIHFLAGAMGYLASPLWLLMLVASSAYVAGAEGVPVLPGGGGEPWLSVSAISGIPAVVPLLAVTAVLLFLPKLLAVGLALVRRSGRFGGATRLLLSALLELAFSVVVAPLMMIYHTRFVLSVLRGRDVEWTAQQRGGGTVAWPAAWRSTRGAVAVGAIWAGLTLYSSPAFFLWMMPVFPGLLLAPALVRWTGCPELGAGARRRRLFLVPSETRPAPVVAASYLPAPVPGAETPAGATRLLPSLPPEQPLATPAGTGAHAPGRPSDRRRAAPAGSDAAD